MIRTNGGRGGTFFGGKTIYLSSKEKEKKISVLSNKDEKENDHGQSQSGKDGSMIKTQASLSCLGETQHFWIGR